MKTRTKIIVIISVAFIVLGGILAVGIQFFYKKPLGVYRTNGRWHYVGAEQETVSIHEAVDPFTTIDIDFDFGKIELIPSDSYRFEFDGMIHEGGEFIHSVESGVLTIKRSYSNKGLQLNFMNFPFWAGPSNNNILRVYYPEGSVFENVKVNSQSSKVTISGVDTTSFSLENDFGDVTLNAIKAKDLSIVINSGSVALTKIEAENATLQADFGDQTLKDVVATTSLSINKASGALFMDSVTANQVNINSDFGEIKGQNLALTNVNVSSSSGNVDLAGSIKGNTNITLDFGEVTLALKEDRTDYDITINQDFGTIYLDDFQLSGNHFENNDGANEMVIKSSSGDVRLNFGK